MSGAEGGVRTYDHLARLFRNEGVTTCFALLGDANMNFATRLDEAGCEILPAQELWGLDTFETHDTLIRKHGDKGKVAAIGQAGERGVKFAAIMTDAQLSAITAMQLRFMTLDELLSLYHRLAAPPFEEMRTSWVHWSRVGIPSADSAAKAITPGPEGGANTAP